MEIKLAHVSNVKGIYKTRDGLLPRRMCLLHPSVAIKFNELNQMSNYSLRFSDMYRTMQSSMTARRNKGKMVARAGYSGHNYGISFDSG